MAMGTPSPRSSRRRTPANRASASVATSTGTPASAALKGKRDVDYALEGVHEAAIYDGEKLESGMTFQGPAVVEDPGTTIVIHPGNSVSVDGYRNIHISVEK